MEARLIFVFLIAFIAVILVMPAFLKVLKKVKAGQNILHYVEEHKGKQGTPTMGGIVFVLVSILVFLCFMKGSAQLAGVSVACFLAFALLGFLDDFFKIRGGKNQGLRAYQKALGQIVIAIVVSLFAFFSPAVSSKLVIPFVGISVNFGVAALFLFMFIFVATTNAVNLTDGLDGLATGVGLVFLGGLVVMLNIQTGREIDLAKIEQLYNLKILTICLWGALAGFFIFNSNKASVFMGDVGSLAIGAFISSVCIFAGLSLYILIFGIMYVVSAVTVILQVVYFKKTKGKRIFLMAPYHHHLQKKGLAESKIVSLYVGISLFAVLFTIAIELI